MKPVESERAAQIGAYKTVDSITILKSSEVDLPTGSVDEENTLSQGNRNEPEPEPQLGEDGKSDTSANADIVIDDGDQLVDVQGAIDNFNRNAPGKIRGGTVRHYQEAFIQFAKFSKLEAVTRRQLQGNKGHELLVDFLKTVSRPTIMNKNSCLKTFWVLGLEFKPGSYPVDLKSDIGRLPPTLKRQTPNDDLVLPWINALETESDRYLDTIIRHMFQLGPRPANICLLNNEHVVLRDGKPFAIRTTGREPGNKNYSPTIARLPPDMVQAIIDMWALNPEHLPGNPLYPFRSHDGVISPSKRMRTADYKAQWERFQKKHNLRPLMRVLIRHWVATKCTRALLPDPCIQAMQGQAMGGGRGMSGVYDQPSDEAIYEEQEKFIPFGPIGVVCPHVMDVTADLPKELLKGLSDVLTGELRVYEYMDDIRAYMERNRQVVPSHIANPNMAR